MRIGRPILIFEFVLLASTLCCWNATAQDADEGEEAKEIYQRVLKGLAKILPRDHLTHHPLDDEISHRWFDLFIHKLDPRHVYFIDADIRRLAEFREQLDDQSRRGELAFAEMVRKTYAQRVLQATSIGLELLDQQHDFTVDEQFELAPNTYPKNEEALRERWRKLVKYQILVERSSGLAAEDAIVKLRARYRRIARDNRLERNNDLYQLYFDTFARSFGPNNRFYGERILSRYRS